MNDALIDFYIGGLLTFAASECVTSIHETKYLRRFFALLTFAEQNRTRYGMCLNVSAIIIFIVRVVLRVLFRGCCQDSCGILDSKRTEYCRETRLLCFPSKGISDFRRSFCYYPACFSCISYSDYERLCIRILVDL